MIKLRNTTNTEIILCDVLFRESGKIDDQHAIPETERVKWANNDAVLQNISNGNIVLSLNDVEASSINYAIDTLKANLPKEVLLPKKSPRTHRPEFTVIEPEGDFDTIVSHDFTDRTTWFQKSVRKTGQTLTNNNGVYESNTPYWIDLSHGRHSKEDNFLVQYQPNVYDDGVLLEEDVDFTINYEDGSVTFTGYSPTGSITADYSHHDTNVSNSSAFKIQPKPDTLLKVRLAEIDFTVDSRMEPIFFEIWGYDPTGTVAPPNKILYDRVIYKNEKDILKIGNDIQEVTKWGDLQNNVKRIVFAYGRSIDLLNSAGMELEIYTKNDVPFQGEMASVSFYVAFEDEQ